jgi:predicted DNA-binding transcriptional regulator AlpA
MDPDKNLDPILSERELAEWLGVSLPSLQRMRAEGTGPRFVQLTQRRIGYRKSAVELWLSARTIDRVGALTAASVPSSRS